MRRPVDALAENGKLLTHLLTTSNQEMLAHLKTGSSAMVETFPIILESTLERVHLNFSGEAGGEKYFNIV